ncbi:helix-turn-helix domain-containing protein [Corynebacterium variabile]|uniref:helix-turn-helix domain-containing protein n=1 Tax=Corynebacterium variabile TaxID=1727 RepID=UPI003FD5AB07
MSTTPAGTTYGPQNLKALRAAAGLSRREFIDRLKDETGLELHQTTIRRLEEGEQTMKASDAVAIADYFKIGIDQFLREPADPIGAELTGLTEKMLKSFRNLGVSLMQFMLDHDNLRERLDKSDVPPAVQSQAVQRASNVESLGASWMPAVEAMYRKLDSPDPKIKGKDDSDDQG